MKKVQPGPILFCGDPHGEFGHIVSVARETDASAVILLGDLEPRYELPHELAEVWSRTWFIFGNHDTDQEDVAARVFDPDIADRTLHLQVIEMPDGTRIAGLGGVFRERVWHPGVTPGFPKYRDRMEHVRATPTRDRWRNGVQRQHWSSIYPAEVEALSRHRTDVLVTHEAPSLHPHGFREIDRLACAMGARAVIHGHHHEDIIYRQEPGLPFITIGVGLRGITTLGGDGQPRVFVPGIGAKDKRGKVSQ